MDRCLKQRLYHRECMLANKLWLVFYGLPHLTWCRRRDVFVFAVRQMVDFPFAYKEPKKMSNTKSCWQCLQANVCVEHLFWCLAKIPSHWWVTVMLAIYQLLFFIFDKNNTLIVRKTQMLHVTCYTWYTERKDVWFTVGSVKSTVQYSSFLNVLKKSPFSL